MAREMLGLISRIMSWKPDKDKVKQRKKNAQVDRKFIHYEKNNTCTLVKKYKNLLQFVGAAVSQSLLIFFPKFLRILLLSVLSTPNGREFLSVAVLNSDEQS